MDADAYKERHTDEEWDLFRTARNDAYKTWNGKGRTLGDTCPYDAAREIVHQAVREGACKHDLCSTNGYHLGTMRGLEGKPLEEDYSYEQE